MRLIFVIVAMLYATISIVAACSQLGNKERIGPSFLMIFGGILMILSVIVRDTFILLLVGIGVIQISSIMFGLSVHGKPHFSHQMIRVFVGVVIAFLYFI